MLNFTPGFNLLIIGGLILTAGDVVMKVWTKTNRPTEFAIGLGIWLIGLVCLGLSFKSQNIAVASLTLVLVNIITLAIVSYVAFHEPLSSRALAGIVLGLIAVALLEIG